MIETTTDFRTHSGDKLRIPKSRVEIDWDLSGNYQDESEYLLLVEVERVLNEPLGGISMAQADIEFTNYNNRFTPMPE